MSGWPTKLLADICSIEIGRTPARANKKFWDDQKLTENVWVSIADMRDDIMMINTSKEHLSDAGAAITPVVPEGALLLSFKLSLGKLAFAGKPLRTNEAIAALIPNDKRALEPKFLYWYLRSFDWAKASRGSEKIKGATLNKAKLKEIPIPLPPLAEQKRIVAFLDEAFAGIARAADNIARNLENARNLYEATLRHEIGKAISDSEMLTLAEISKDFGRGRSRHRPRNDKSLYGGDYPFIQTGDIRNSGHFIEGYSQTYNKKGLAQSKLWPKGTICITIAANIAETGVLTFDACFPDSVIGVVVDPAKAVSDYVEYALQYFKAELQAQGKGSAQDNINMGTFENARFPFPSLDRQIAIVEKLSVLEAHCRRLAENYQAKLGAMGELKQSLLHQAFSGKLTGKEAEAA